MQRTIIMCLCLILVGCEKKKEKKIALETRMQKYSYHLGLELGSQLRLFKIKLGDSLESELVARGVMDMIENNELLVSTRELRRVKLSVENEMMEEEAKAKMQRDPEFEALAKKNREESEAFLEQNRQKEGIRTTESGLQYEIVESGSGKSPSLKDEVRVHLLGTLVDGTEFENTKKSGQGPAKYRVQHLIEGFVEALQMMQEGDKWKVYFPAELAYGMRGREPHIGPSAALIFEVELLEVIPNQYEYKRK